MWQRLRALLARVHCKSCAAAARCAQASSTPAGRNGGVPVASNRVSMKSSSTIA
jgi:hypothetical protein